MGRDTERFWNSQFDTTAAIPDFAAWQDRHEALSARADAFGAPQRIPTGPHDAQVVWRSRLHCGPAGGGAALGRRYRT